MTVTAVATRQTVWDCKWSRPGYRLSRVVERDQPETAWVCVRSGARSNIADMGCDRCPYWLLDSHRVEKPECLP